MVHTPCGPEHHNADAPCQVNGKCSNSFPKSFHDQTTVNDDSYANLQRHDTGKTLRSKVIRLTICGWLHIVVISFGINVESIASIKAIKYIYKYVYKGHDCTTMEFGCCQDEIKLYLDSRYVSACEGVWCIFHFHVHQESPPVVHLQVHLKGEQMLTWDKNMALNLQAVLEQNAAKDTKLTAYFKANSEYPEARETLYQDFPSKFV